RTVILRLRSREGSCRSAICAFPEPRKSPLAATFVPTTPTDRIFPGTAGAPLPGGRFGCALLTSPPGCSEPSGRAAGRVQARKTIETMTSRDITHRRQDIAGTMTHFARLVPAAAQATARATMLTHRRATSVAQPIERRARW